MSVTCPECNIRYATDLPACPWCGHTSRAAAVSTALDEEHTHTETRSSPPPPPPPPPRERRPSSVRYDLSQIPGPDEEWEPVDEWLDDGHDEWVPETRRRARGWILTVAGAIALLAFGAWLAEVLPIGVGSSDEPAPSVTAAPATQAPTTVTPPQTTVAPATTAPPPPTTTAQAVIDPVGSPLAAADLQLRETALGELEFGADGTEVLGRLVATFGQPTADSGPTPSGGEESGGFCEGELQRRVTWGGLEVYNAVGSDGTETFASVHITSADGPGSELTTLSGLRVGDTLADLRSLYDGFRIDVAEPFWEVRAGSDGRLLLWGTADGAAGENLITSIRSSLRCSA